MKNWIIKSVFALTLFISFQMTGQEKTINAKEVSEQIISDTKKQEFGKFYSVTGVVTKAEVSKYLTPAVYISDQKGGKDLFVCVMPRSKMFKLSNFKEGDKVSFKGSFYLLKEGVIVLKQAEEL